MRVLDIGQTAQLARVWRIPPGVAIAETKVRVLEVLHFRKQRGINRPESRVRVVVEDARSPVNGFEGWLDWGLLATRQSVEDA